MTRRTKKRVAFAAEFNKAAGEIAVQKFGARKIDDETGSNYFPFVMTTVYGEMRIWPATDPESVLDGRHRGSFFTVFCRFETHDRAVLGAAADRLGSNPYSGKYNFHYDCSSECELETVLRAFERHLAIVVVT